MEANTIRIALAGNPNTGKTTLFNALTGSNQFVGNWPGVTVEKKEGKLKGHEGPETVIVTDLPGIYSLSPYTLEEVVARNYLVVECPDAILNIIDGTNLERNLYLTTQLTELGIPVVMAINMVDVLRKRGDKIDLEALSHRMGCPAVEISALKGTGLEEAVALAIETAKHGRNIPHHIFSGEVEHTLAHIEEAAVHGMPADRQRWYAIKIFERDEKVLAELQLDPAILSHIEEDIKETEKLLDDDAEAIIINERYNYITSILKGCFKRKHVGKLSTSEKIDKVVTNRIAALPIFAAIMFLVYYISVSTVGTFVTDFMNDGLFGEGFDFFGHWVNGIPVLVEAGLTAAGTPVWLNSLILDGIVGGVGAVLGFVPQILVLFIMLAILEDIGYMARIAFVMDRPLRRIGLSGRSIVPMLIGFGCTVPGVMASRTLPSDRDRKMTIMLTPFMSCSAKIPIYGFLANAFFPGKAGFIMIGLYVLDIIIGILMAFLYRRTLFRGDAVPFVMELPNYRLPAVSNVMRLLWDKARDFLQRAFTVIFLASMVIWFMQTFDFRLQMVGDHSELSMLAQLAGFVSPIFEPMGFGDWRITTALVSGFLAKEVVVSTLGSLMAGTSLSAVLTAPAALSLMVFCLLYTPCVATISTIRRELGTTWAVVIMCAQCLIAWCCAALAAVIL